MHHLSFRTPYLGKPTNTLVDDVPLETEENYDAFGYNTIDRRPTWLKTFTYEDLGKQSDQILDFATSKFDAPTNNSTGAPRLSGSIDVLLELTEDNINEYGDLLR